MPYSSLPKPMLSRSGRLPAGGDWSFEVKWDGFRAIVSTEGPLRVRSRRGWSMTDHVLFLANLPVRAVLDGELVALDEQGKPDFPRVCERVLNRHDAIPLTYMIFDLLSLDGCSLIGEPWSERRRILEGLSLDGPRWRTPMVFDDGAALWEAVCEHELEGVVAKRRSGRYLPGELGWIKTKNRAHWRWELEREGAIRTRQRSAAARASFSTGPDRWRRWLPTIARGTSASTSTAIFAIWRSSSMLSRWRRRLRRSGFAPERRSVQLSGPRGRRGSCAPPR